MTHDTLYTDMDSSLLIPINLLVFNKSDRELHTSICQPRIKLTVTRTIKNIGGKQYSESNEWTKNEI